MRDERKVMLLGRHTPGKPKIQLYTSSGISIGTIIVSRNDHISSVHLWRCNYADQGPSGTCLNLSSSILRPLTSWSFRTKAYIAYTTSPTLLPTPNIPSAQKCPSWGSSMQRGMMMGLWFSLAVYNSWRSGAGEEVGWALWLLLVCSPRTYSENCQLSRPCA